MNSILITVNRQNYQVIDRPGLAPSVMTVKSLRGGGQYLSTITEGTATYKRVLKAHATQQAQPEPQP